MDLQNIREEINAMDKNIMQSLQKRLECSKQVAKEKQKTNASIFVETRENQVLATVTQGKPLEEQLYFSSIYRSIMKMSRHYQYRSLLEHKKEAFASRTTISLPLKNEEPTALLQLLRTGAFFSKKEKTDPERCPCITTEVASFSENRLLFCFLNTSLQHWNEALSMISLLTIPITYLYMFDENNFLLECNACLDVVGSALIEQLEKEIAGYRFCGCYRD